MARILKSDIIKHFDRHGFRTFYAHFITYKDTTPDKDGNVLQICPFHDDHEPSLALNINNGYYKCFGCNATGDIFRFVEKLRGLTFPDAINYINSEFNIMKQTYKNNHERRALSTIDHVYTYTDETGRELFQAVKFINPKKFLQRHTNKKGLYDWNLIDCRMVLYNLTGIIKNDTIYYVEGEKDCETLMELGLCATTNPTGSNGWKDTYGQYLENKHVILIPDNDDPGRELMQRIGNSIIDKVASLKLITMPGLADKEDITDWFEHDNSLEEFMTIVDSTIVLSETREILPPGRIFPITSATQDINPMTADEILVFPRHMFTGAVKKFVDVHSEILESPPEFFGMCYITALGHVLAHKIELAVALPIHPRLYLLLLGKSGFCRKSTAIDFVHEFFLDSLKHENVEYKIVKGMNSGEALESIFHENSDTKAKRTDLYGNEIITEPINTLLIYSDEFSGLMKKANIKNSTLLENLNTLYSSTLYTSATKNTFCTIEKLHISIIAATTNTSFNRMFNASATEDGFLNRLCIIPGDSVRKHFLPPPIPKDELKLCKEGLLEIINFAKNGVNLTLTPDAIEIGTKYYKTLSAEIEATRLENLTLRIVQLLTIIKKQDVIDAETMNEAIEFVNWQYKARLSERPIVAHNDEAKLEQKIMKYIKKHKMCTLRKLKIDVHASRYSQTMTDKVIRSLETAGYIFKSRGKRKDSIIINLGTDV